MCQAWGMRAYSVDLRTRVLDAVDRGIPRTEVATTFKVSLATIKRYIKQRRDTGQIVPKRPPGGAPRIGPEQYDVLQEQLEANDTLKLSEHCQLWWERYGVAVSISTMSRAIQRVGWTRKKGCWVPVSEMSRHERLGESR